MVYMDHAATTPLRPEVFDAMRPFLLDQFANASGSYAAARTSRQAIDLARQQVASLIGAKPQEIYFTSGGSEADNWALRGAMLAAPIGKNHLVTTSIEHHAVLRTCDALARIGFSVSFLPVQSNGTVNPADLAAAIRPETALISVMLANNEVGSIEPVSEIVQIAKIHHIPVHTDAVQAVGHISVDVNQLGVDLLSLSAHKFGGPKGIGALYVRKGTRIDALITGGEQEMGMRAGTENTAGIVGMGKAATLAQVSLAKIQAHVTSLRDAMIGKLQSAMPNIRVNALDTDRLPGHVHITIPDADTSLLLMLLDMKGIAASAGSACASGSHVRSHVLTAMGYAADACEADLRFTLGETNTLTDVDAVVQALADILLK